jgi:hypothetical protein
MKRGEHQQAARSQPRYHQRRRHIRQDVDAGASTDQRIKLVFFSLECRKLLGVSWRHNFDPGDYLAQLDLGLS